MALALVASIDNWVNYSVGLSFHQEIFVVFALNNVLYFSECLYYMVKAATFVKSYRKVLIKAFWAVGIVYGVIFLAMSISMWEELSGSEAEAQRVQCRRPLNFDFFVLSPCFISIIFGIVFLLIL